MRKLTVVAIALVAFIAGAFLGAFGMRELCRWTLVSYDMANIDHLSTLVSIQRFQGTPEAYEAALHNFLIALDERERAHRSALIRNDILFSSEMVYADRTFAYIRLSLLAAQRGRVDEAAKYQTLAMAACPHAYWKTCTWDNLSRLVQMVDEHSVWNPQRSVSNHGS